MRRKIPSTTALISFEAAARHESFTKAAQELSLTQGAICRQIASLRGVPQRRTVPTLPARSEADGGRAFLQPPSGHPTRRG
jgi:Bacterial regulatory helix-turn-helix protein, lysR family.